MKFLEEVVVDEFLPTFRSLLAADLRQRGLTQHEVADLLGVSQSAVSKYAHGDVTVNQAVADDERVQETVVRIGGGLASGDMSQVQALVEAEVLIRRLSARGDVVADLHDQAMPALADYDGDFRVHDPESEVRVRERVVSSVRRGVRMLEHASGFATLIPAVGSNLVECTPEADGVEDVAGVPGRILDVMGRTEIPADPEFGVSVHVASILLAARDAGSDARACLNVRYDDDILDELAALGYDCVAFDPEGEDSAAALRPTVAEHPDADVLYQTGGFGVEPIVYLLADSAPAAAELARELL